MTKSNLILYLAQLGLIIEPYKLFTASQAAIDYCNMKKLKKILLIVPDSEMKQDFSCFDLTDKNPDAIVLGDMGPLFNFQLLNKLFIEVMAGCQIIAMHKNEYWMATDGLRMDLGAFVAAIEYASGKSAIIIGKPDINFFKLATIDWKCSHNLIYMIGDDINVDILGAKNAGLNTILVKTGKFREHILVDSTIKPDHIIESVADLPTLFGLG
jgi:HAD superfamily hydrolase (TIGR01458 family)